MSVDLAAYVADLPDQRRTFQWPAARIQCQLLYKSMCVIHNHNNNESEDGTLTGDLTGMRLWPGAELVAHYIVHLHSQHSLPPTVIELGAGTGLCSLVAAKCGCAVIATDGVDEVVSLIHRNISANTLTGSMVAAKLEWGSVRQTSAAVQSLRALTGDSSAAFQLLVAADVLYPTTTQSTVTALVTSVRQLMDQSPEGVRLLLSYYHRSTATSVMLVDTAKSNGFTIRVIDRRVFEDDKSVTERENQLGVRGYLLELSGDGDCVSDEYSKQCLHAMCTDEEWEQRQFQLLTAQSEALALPIGLDDCDDADAR